MVTKKYVTNGTPRTIDYKVFGDEVRVYRIYGDITKRDEIEQLAQEIAFDTKCSNVVINL